MIWFISGGTIGGVAAVVFQLSVDVGIEVLGGSSLVGGTVGLLVAEGCVGRGDGVGWIGLMVGGMIGSVVDVFGVAEVDGEGFVVDVLSGSPPPRRRITSGSTEAPISFASLECIG